MQDTAMVEEHVGKTYEVRTPEGIPVGYLLTREVNGDVWCVAHEDDPNNTFRGDPKDTAEAALEEAKRIAAIRNV